MFRPSSGWNTASEESYLFDLNVGVQGGGRDLVYKYGDSGHYPHICKQDLIPPFPTYI